MNSTANKRKSKNKRFWRNNSYTNRNEMSESTCSTKSGKPETTDDDTENYIVNDSSFSHMGKLIIGWLSVMGEYSFSEELVNTKEGNKISVKKFFKMMENVITTITDKAENQAASFEFETDTLQAELDDLKEKNGILNENLDLLRKEDDDIHSNLEDHMDKYEHLMEKIKQGTISMEEKKCLENKTDALSRDLEASTEEIGLLEKKVEILKENLEASKEENVRLRNEIKNKVDPNSTEGNILNDIYEQLKDLVIVKNQLLTQQNALNALNSKVTCLSEKMSTKPSEDSLTHGESSHAKIDVDNSKGSWASVVKGRTKNRELKSTKVESINNHGELTNVNCEGKDGVTQSCDTPLRSTGSLPRRKIFRDAAISITARTEKFSYYEVLKRARDNISLKTLGIEEIKTRRTTNGAILIEIMGDNMNNKADILTEELRKLFQDEVNITRLTKRGTLKITGIDDSIDTDEIVNALSTTGEYPKDGIKVSPTKRTIYGTGAIWAQLPLSAAYKIAKENKLKIGWTTVHIELLENNPVQCYECWKFGHVRQMCKSEIDHGGDCYKCGQTGHLARNCGSPLCCILCRDAGLSFGHRIGGALCGSLRERKRLDSTLREDLLNQ